MAKKTTNQLSKTLENLRKRFGRNAFKRAQRETNVEFKAQRQQVPLNRNRGSQAGRIN
jgi:hypothetical protein